MKKGDDMEKRTVEITSYVFDKVEKGRLIAILQYAKHRLNCHPNCGLERARISIEFVDYLLREL